MSAGESAATVAPTLASEWDKVDELDGLQGVLRVRSRLLMVALHSVEQYVEADKGIAIDGLLYEGLLELANEIDQTARRISVLVEALAVSVGTAKQGAA